MEGTVFTPSLEGMKNVKSEQGEMLTKPFLDVCKLILPVIDKFGAAMVLVKSDIGGNITRLETKYSSDLSKYEYLYSMVQEEVDAKTAKGQWISWWSFFETYWSILIGACLKPAQIHMQRLCRNGMAGLPAPAFQLPMKLAPDRKKFKEVIGGSAGNINADIEKFCTSFPRLLQENHKFLASVGLDDIKAS